MVSGVVLKDFLVCQNLVKCKLKNYLDVKVDQHRPTYCPQAFFARQDFSQFPQNLLQNIFLENTLFIRNFTLISYPKFAY